MVSSSRIAHVKYSTTSYILENFYMFVANNALDSSSIWIWHFKLRYPASYVFMKFPFLTKSFTITWCDACDVENKTRLPFPQNYLYSKVHLETIHFDIRRRSPVISHSSFDILYNLLMSIVGLLDFVCYLINQMPLLRFNIS